MAEKLRQIEGEPEPGGVLDDESLVDEGDVITVVWGKESFSPVRYFNVEVGPFRLTVRVRKGETPRQAIERANSLLEATAADAWKKKVRAHLGRIPESHAMAMAASKGKG